MKIFTEEEQEALEDGASALRYRAGRLRSHELFESKPEAEEIAAKYERHAAMLDEIAQKEVSDTTPPYSKAKYGFGDELEAGLYKIIDEKIESIGDLVIENERLKKERDAAEARAKTDYERFTEAKAGVIAADSARVAAEAQRDTLAAAHRAIVERHPDAQPGEHPAVDIARAALAAVKPPEER
jgi:hypothetical protein